MALKAMMVIFEDICGGNFILNEHFVQKFYLELTQKRLFRLPRDLPKTPNLVLAWNDQIAKDLGLGTWD